MFKVPIYSFQNYHQITEKHYSHQDTNQRIDFSFFSQLLDDKFISKYAYLDARKLNTLNISDNYTTTFADKQIKIKDLIIATKLLIPTLWNSNYYMRNIGEGEHTGIDIILPKGTPIISLSEGKVFRIKIRNRNKKDEGNSIVIQNGEIFFSYTHLDTINVQLGQDISRGEILGTCGSTGKAIQTHIHIQVDKIEAPFHPYRGKTSKNIQKNTLDPLQIIKDIQQKSLLFTDIPIQKEYYQAIVSLTKRGIIKGTQSNIYPNKPLLRKETILINKIAEKYRLYSQLPIIHHQIPKFTDIQDKVLQSSLQKLLQYDLINYNDKHEFLPNQPLTGIERLQILGRLLLHTTSDDIKEIDSIMQTSNIISNTRKYLNVPIPRKEAFLILYKTLKLKKII